MNGVDTIFQAMANLFVLPGTSSGLDPSTVQHVLVVEVPAHTRQLLPGAKTFGDVLPGKYIYHMRLAQWLCTFAQLIARDVHIEIVPSRELGIVHSTLYEQSMFVLFYRFFLILDHSIDAAAIGDVIFTMFTPPSQDEPSCRSPIPRRKRLKSTVYDGICPITSFAELCNIINGIHQAVMESTDLQSLPLLDKCSTDAQSTGNELVSALSFTTWATYPIVRNTWSGHYSYFPYTVDVDQTYADAYNGNFPFPDRVHVLGKRFPTHDLSCIFLPHIDIDGSSLTDDASMDTDEPDACDVTMEGEEAYTQPVRHILGQSSDMNALIFPTMTHLRTITSALLRSVGSNPMQRLILFNACLHAADKLLSTKAPGVPSAYIDAATRVQEYKIKRRMDPVFLSECCHTVHTGSSALADMVIKLGDVLGKDGLASNAGMCITLFFAATAAGVSEPEVMRPHVVLHGKYGKGKTRRVHATLNLLAPGTFRRTDSVTPKYDQQGGTSVPGTNLRVGENDENLRVVFMDEIGGTLLGVDGVASAEAKDKQAILTHKLTSGFVSCSKSDVVLLPNGTERRVEITIQKASSLTMFACCNAPSIGDAMKSRVTLLPVTPHMAFPPSQDIPIRTLHDNTCKEHAVARYVNNIRDVHALTYVWEARYSMGLPGYGVFDTINTILILATQRILITIKESADGSSFKNHPFVRLFLVPRTISSLNMLARAIARCRTVWLATRTGLLSHVVASLDSPEWTRSTTEWVLALSQCVVTPEDIIFAATSMCPDATKQHNILIDDVICTVKSSMLLKSEEGSPVQKYIQGRKMYIIDHGKSFDAKHYTVAEGVLANICDGYDTQNIKDCVRRLVTGIIKNKKGRAICTTTKYGAPQQIMYYCIDAAYLNTYTCDIEFTLLKLLRVSIDRATPPLPRKQHNILLHGKYASWLSSSSPDLPGLASAGIDSTYAIALLQNNHTKVLGGGGGVAQGITCISVNDKALCSLLQEQSTSGTGGAADLSQTALGFVLKCCPIGWKQDLITAIEPCGRPNEFLTYRAIPQREEIIMERPNRLSDTACVYTGASSPEFDEFCNKNGFCFNTTKRYIHIPPGSLFTWFLSYWNVWTVIQSPLPSIMQPHNVIKWLGEHKSSACKINLACSITQPTSNFANHLKRAQELEIEYETKGGIDSIALRAHRLAQHVLASFPMLSDPIILTLATNPVCV